MKSIAKFDEMIETRNKMVEGEIKFDSLKYREVYETLRNMTEGEQKLFHMYEQQKDSNNRFLVVDMSSDWGKESEESFIEALEIYGIDNLYAFGVFSINVEFLFNMQNNGWSMNNKMVVIESEAYGCYHNSKNAPVIEMYKMF